ncbi:hypothetical protein T4B_10304, partial [Trichinella pseudospiralis]
LLVLRKMTKHLFSKFGYFTQFQRKKFGTCRINTIQVLVCLC